VLGLVCGYALATDYNPGDTDSQTITVQMNVQGAAQVEWQDLDSVIDDTAKWATALEGIQYAAPPDDQGNKATDAWAGWDNGRYYECFVANDAQPHLFLKSNVELDLAFDATELTHTSDSTKSLPTWFTCSVYGLNYSPYTPFLENSVELGGPGSQQQMLLAPAGTVGHYLDENPDALLGDFGVGAFHPNQHAFPCGPSGSPIAYSMHLDGSVQGGMDFHFRVKRNALLDAQGSYQGSLNVSLTAGTTP
jgi:hypothetical protein